MDNRLLLVKAVTLLYRESLLSNRSENSCDLVRTVLENIKVAEINLTINKERDIIQALKQTALEMCENTVDHEYEKVDLLQRLKLNCLEDDALYDSFVQGIEPELAEASIKRSVINIRKSITNHFREQKVEEILSKAAVSFRHGRDKIKNVHSWVSDLISELEPFQVATVAKDPAVVDDIDVGDEKSVSSVFDDIKANSSGEMILKTGWQAINTMLQGGIRRGETGAICALQHKYKTGFSLSLFKQIALYNKPWMLDSTKKPLLLRISFEDSIAANIQFLYQSLKENETGEKADVSNISNEEMAAYVKEKLQVNGYHVKMMRVDPSQWTYVNICNKILELEAEGYEVHLLMIDYLAMIPTTGCTIGPMGSDLRDMFRRMRNFCSARKIACVTPHQLSTEAKQLLRDGRTDFVKIVAGLGYYDKCRTIDNELDWELYIHIEKKDKNYYLTIQRGKHRLTTVIDSEDMYAVYQFFDIGGIPDDLDKENTASKKVGAPPVGGNSYNESGW
jgi:hypothetical protein